MLDGNDADDKIISVLRDDATYGHIRDISEIPAIVTDRLRHRITSYNVCYTKLLR